MAKRSAGLSFYKKKKKISSGAVKEMLSFLFCGFLAIFLGIILVYFFGMKCRVIGSSMEPVVYADQEILVDRFTYIFSTPRYGDIVLFLPNGNENSQYYVKRIIARAGDKVKIEDGIVYVNGIPSTVVKKPVRDPGIASKELLLENGQYFVMGDDSVGSEDSRSANIGPVDVTSIVGKVWYGYACESSEGGLVHK